MATPLQKFIPQPFWKNPVVVRDMRVRLRGSRAFWNQAFYLGLLCLIALLGYGASVRSGTGESLDPVTVQRDLQGFYYYIFVALALLISLIAPALTAVSIISERQRLTLDLLVTTPMTSMQMLTGKLVSSIAFILLLLALSIPVSALCVMLGGATLGDVLQTYALLAIDAVVLSAVGLAFSCSAKQNVQAIVGTYAAIVISYFVSFSVGTTLMGFFFGGFSGASSAPVPTIAALLYLNPVITIMAPGHPVNVFGVAMPAWLATGAAALLLVRLLLTGAALRLGLYGGGLVASLRRQVLLCAGIVVFLVAQSAFGTIGSYSAQGAEAGMNSVCVAVLAICLFFLASLFVPVTDEDAPVAMPVRERYAPLQAFSTHHAGSLPYFHLLLVVALGCALLGAISGEATPVRGSMLFGGAARAAAAGAGAGVISVRPLLIGIALNFAWLSGLGFLMWSLARRTAWLSATATGARPFAFLLFLFIFFVPYAVMLVISQTQQDVDPLQTSWIRYLWIGYPLTDLIADPSRSLATRYLVGAGLSYLFGVLVYPPWASVTPGGGMIFKKRERQRAVPRTAP